MERRFEQESRLSPMSSVSWVHRLAACPPPLHFHPLRAGRHRSVGRGAHDGAPPARGDVTRCRRLPGLPCTDEDMDETRRSAQGAIELPDERANEGSTRHGVPTMAHRQEPVNSLLTH